MSIVFFGTSEFSQKILAFLLENSFPIAAIVTKPDKPQGRSRRVQPSQVKAFAKEHVPDIPLFDPVKASTEVFAAELKKFDPEVFIVVSYGEIIKQNLLSIPKIVNMNIHPSLLPKYRGAAPIQRAIMEGETQTGVTIIEMTLELDAGAIIDQVEVPILENQTFGELEEVLCETSCERLKYVLEHLSEKIKHKRAQDSNQATYAAKIQPSEYQIDWTKGAAEIHHLIRALSPRPGAWSWMEIGADKKRCKIFRTKFHKKNLGKPGDISHQDRKNWYVSCGEGHLELIEVQLEGKRRMSFSECFLGLSSVPVFLS